MSKLEIESGVDIPAPTKSKYDDIPLGDMEVGQSVFVPKPEARLIQAHINSIRAHINNWRHRHGKRDMEFITRGSEEGLRIWRTK